MVKSILIFLTMMVSLFNESFSQNLDYSGDQFNLIWEKYATVEPDQIPYDSLQKELEQYLRQVNQSENQMLESWLYPYYQFALRLYRYAPNRAANFLLPLSHYEWESPIDSVYDRLGRMFNLMGLALKNSQRPADGANQLAKAIYYFNKSKLKDPLILPSMYNNVANTYQNLGDFDKAVEYCKEGNRQILQAIEKKEITDESIQRLYELLIPLKQNWAIILAKMGYYYDAIEQYKKAEEIAKNYSSSYLSMIYENLAISFHKTNQKDSAKFYYLKSIEMARSDKNVQVAINASVNLLGLYSQAVDIHHFTQLKENLIDELELLNHNEFTNRLISTIYIQEAEVFLNKKQALKALGSIQRAYWSLSGKEIQISDQQLLKKLDKYPYQSLDMMHMASEVLIRSGIQTNSIAELNQATGQLLLAENLIDSLRSVIVSQESKLILNEQQTKIYHTKADVCQYLYNIEGKEIHLQEMFNTIERGKSAGLWNEMQQQDLKAAYIPDSLLQQEKQLKNELAQILNNIKKQKETYDSDPNVINNLESRSFTLSGSLDSLYRIYNERYPEFYKLKFGNETRSLTEIQNLLKPREVFVQLFVTGNQIHELLVKKDTLLYQALPNVDELLDVTNQLLQALKPRRYNYTREEFSAFSDAANKLYLSFFEAFKTDIQGCNLIISPDNIFSLFPFEILVSQKPPETTFDFGELNYMIFDHSIIYTNTATLWASHRSAAQSENSTGPALAFAPYYEVARGDRPFSAIYGETLPKLPGTLEEVKDIKKRFKGRYFIKQAATESRYKKYMQDASILHLAMHTIIDNDEPLNSFLAFYPEKNGENDGRLSGSEILNYEINAQLVVLSACNSGSGKVRAGEGILGLSRSFIQAGSQSLLLNLWTMDDTQGKNLIISFYSYISKGLSVAEALQRAKIDHLRSSRPLLAHPHYWAGLVAQGTDLHPVLPTKNSNYWLYLLLLIPLGGLTWLLIKKLGPK